MARLISSIVLTTSLVMTAAHAGELHWRSGSVATEFVSSQAAAQQLHSLARASTTARVVVQFDRPITSIERSRLAAAGVRLLNYVGNNAYFARVDAARFNEADVAALSALRVVLPIQRDWKLHPTLACGEIVPWALVRDAATDVDKTPGDTDNTQPHSDNPIVACYVQFHRDVDLAGEGLPTAARHNAVIRSRIRSINAAVIELPYHSLLALADEDAVQYIEPPLPAFSPCNDSNRDRTGANIAQDVPYELDGTGISVMVYDAGSVLTDHPDMVGRATNRDGSGLSDHATHVAGTIGGDGTASGGSLRGMAPGVSIESYEFETAGPLQAGFLYTDPGDLEADYIDAINVWGAALANNSIGTNVASNGFDCDWTGDYGVTSALIDAIVAGSLGRPFRIVWANGNERSSTNCGVLYHSTAPPACAKNHITVGALNSNDDSVTSFTSWGPTDDGRIKPDISAPGCQSNADQGVTSCSSSGAYNTKCGTSMASPTVAGLSALLLQDFRAHYPGAPDFRGSTLKALLAHTAEDIENIGPDYKTGYGSVRIESAIDQMRSGNWLEAEVIQGQTRPSLIVVPAGTAQLKVTIAWDDVPAAPNVIPSLINDLDLRVIDPASGEHLPWTLDPATPEAPAIRTQPDRRNNIEQVVIDSPPPGKYIIEVVGHNIPEGTQIYSLVASPNLIDCTPTGALSFARESLACDDVLALRLNDCDLNTSDAIAETIELTVRSDTEPAGEPLLLVETAPETATFIGLLPVSETDATGTLHVTEGDTISSSYLDADDGQGNQNVLVEAFAAVDCSSPDVTNVQFVDVLPRSARVTFETDEPAQVTVYFGHACGVMTYSATAPGYNTSHSIALTDLTDATHYRLFILASDAAGNGTIEDNNGACFGFTTPDVPDYFTQQFYTGFDLAYSAIEFVPNGSLEYYAACRYDTLILPTDPMLGTLLALSDDGSESIGLHSGKQVSIYGDAYDIVHINANGNITLDRTDSDSSESIDDHFDSPRISALFDDFDPAAGGEVRAAQLDDRYVVSWLDVPEDGVFNRSTFQIELFFDGMIRITWLNVDAQDGIVGLSQGLDVPIDYLLSDLSELDACGSRPPTAGDDDVVVGQDRETFIALRAVDDGLPVPPGALAYTITALPTYELRDASNDHLIQPSDLPYTLTAGNAVTYASTSFIGEDTFAFLVDDGGTPPGGGASNTATVTVYVNPVILLPFADSFPTQTFEPDKWVEAFNATIDDVGLSIPSPPYAARFNGQPVGFDSITSHLIDLSAIDAVRLTYGWQRTGGGEDPDSGENLVVEFFNDAGEWELIAEYAGDGEDMTSFMTESEFLPTSALHDSFQLRFSSTGSADADEAFDDWFLDDVTLSLADAPFAESDAYVVEIDGFRDIALSAVDPNNDTLTFAIVALPANGTLIDLGNGTPIEPNDLPYTLVGNGHEVRYAPDTAYTGPDAFEFVADDGTHTSNVATISLVVEPILGLPFADSFPTTDFDADKWRRTVDATIDSEGLNEPSPPYAARFNGIASGGDLLESFAIDLSTISPVRLHYAWQRTGAGDSPETGEDLLVEYLDDVGVWRTLNRHEGAGDDMDTFELANVLLPESALHRDFRLRFRSESGGTTGDDWFVDDVLLFLPTVPEAHDQVFDIARFSFAAIVLFGIDPNDDPLEFTILALPAVGELIDADAGVAIEPTDLPYTTLNGSAKVEYHPPLGFTGTATFDYQVSDGANESNVATVTVNVAAPEFAYNFPLEVDPGWSVDGDWAFGQPLGIMGDPIAGFTGTKVYGYNLAGVYGHNINPPDYLTTVAIDCAHLTGTTVRFYRWLGVESSFFDHATLEVSNNGVDWHVVWENGVDSIDDNDWLAQEFDISAVADRQPVVYVRWGMGPTDGGVSFQGWNLDDISIAGSLQPVAGDLDLDGDVDGIDERGFPLCIFGDGVWPDPPSPMTPGDCVDAFDFDGDDDVDCDDWIAFIFAWTGPPDSPTTTLDDCGLPGDANCDGVIDLSDVAPFALRFVNPARYAVDFPGCPDRNIDLDGNHRAGFEDINPFVNLLLEVLNR